MTRSKSIFAVPALLVAMFPSMALAQETPPPADTPVVVIEDRALRERSDLKDVTLSEPLTIQEADGTPIVVLPQGTTVGRDKTEARFAAPEQQIRQRTDLRNVTLSEAVTLTDPRTGEAVSLPAGTVLRVKLDQRKDADGNILRNRTDIRAVLPDGTRLRIRDRSPEIEAVDVENEVENEVENGVSSGDRHRQRGRDVAKPEDNSSSARVASSDRSGRGERSGSGRGERAGSSDRSGPSDRAGRSERPDRVDRSGSSSGRH